MTAREWLLRALPHDLWQFVAIDLNAEVEICELYAAHIREECAKIADEMAVCYDSDMEGCDARELDRYSEGIECSRRLAEAIRKGER